MARTPFMRHGARGVRVGGSVHVCVSACVGLCTVCVWGGGGRRNARFIGALTRAISHCRSRAALFVFFVILAAAGTLLLALLRPVAAPHEGAVTLLAGAVDGVAAAGARDDSPLGLAKAGLSQLRDVRLQLLCAMFWFSGFELAFWTGEFTQLLDESCIGLVLTMAGAGEVLGGVVVGKMSDRLGRSLALSVGVLAYAVGLGLTLVLKNAGAAPAGPTVVPLLAAFCFGVGDAGFNTQVFALLGSMYPDAHGSGGSFTIFQFVQNLGSAVGFYIQVPLPLHGAGGTLVQLYLQASMLVTSALMFYRADCLHRSPRQLRSSV